MHVPVQLSVPVPSTLEPALKVTDPVSPLAAELTVAVKVTGSPYTLGDVELTTAVVVGALLIVMFCSTSSAAL